ncbi:MAG: DUF6882 domain-containing protein [Maribacter sp.]
MALFSNSSLNVILTSFCLLFCFMLKGQSDFDLKITAATTEMNLRNMYQKILWQMQPTNQYSFDQGTGEVRYTVKEKGYEVYVKPKVLGTFNLKDKTFLWADKNSSINKNISGDIDAFRKTIPIKYQKDKFKSSVEFSEDLLALLAHYLNANGSAYQRQENIIIFYALMNIKILKDGETLIDLEPKNHIKMVKNDTLITMIKKFHSEQLAINRLSNDGKIDDDTAFEQIKHVDLKYWHNEDPYFFPSLCWPCDFDEGSIVAWNVFKTEDDRTFVMYTTDQGWTVENYAYEIENISNSEKFIVNKF